MVERVSLVRGATYAAQTKVQGMSTPQEYSVQATGPSEASKIIRILFGDHFERLVPQPYRERSALPLLAE